jgi:hypothetical protein
MKQHRLQDQIPPPRISDDGPTKAWAVWVSEQWRAVHVIQLDAARHLADRLDRVRVRAVIHLGLLSPADVRVDAVAGAGEPVGASHQRVHEMWSVQSYRNGAFVFEGLIAAESLDGYRMLAVTVRPRSAHEDLSRLRTVVRSTKMDPEPAAQRSVADVGSRQHARDPASSPR